jgi:hypothetical protein
LTHFWSERLKLTEGISWRDKVAPLGTSSVDGEDDARDLEQDEAEIPPEERIAETFEQTGRGL